MKKTLFTVIAFILFTGCAFAQTDKGNSTLGLNLQFIHFKENTNLLDFSNNTTIAQNTKNTVFNVGPSYSYFIADNLDLGANLSYGISNNSSSATSYYSAQKQSINSYGGAIYLRKYVMYQSKVGLRTGPYFNYSRNNTTISNVTGGASTENKTHTNNYVGGLNLELLFYPTKQLGVSLMMANLNYQHYNTKGEGNGTSNGDGNGVNLNFINNGLGVSVFYTFGK